MSKMSVSKMSGKHLTAIVAIGAALSFGMGAAFAADDVTEDQILKALAPAKKPLTRGLSAGPRHFPVRRYRRSEPRRASGAPSARRSAD